MVVLYSSCVGVPTMTEGSRQVVYMESNETGEISSTWRSEIGRVWDRIPMPQPLHDRGAGKDGPGMG